MEAGKWIVLAFLAGAVLVGFRTRQLKTYEFLVCGLFVLLLDGLVFDGQISRWVGDLGTGAQNAADHGLGAGAVVFFTPALRAKLAGFGRRIWAHRPHWSDYAALAALTAAAHWWLGWSWWIGAVLAAVLAGVVIVNAADPPDGDDGDTDDDPLQRGADREAGGDG